MGLATPNEARNQGVSISTQEQAQHPQPPIQRHRQHPAAPAALPPTLKLLNPPHLRLQPKVRALPLPQFSLKATHNQLALRQTTLGSAIILRMG